MDPLKAPPRPPLAMIVSGHEWTARSMESVLVPHGYTILRAFQAGDVLRQLARVQPDLFLLDANLPDGAGIDLCRSLKSSPLLNPATPIILTSAGPLSRRERIEALRAGAWEVFGLPLDAEELVLKLGSFVRAKLATDEARESSLLDDATGLYNVRGLLHRVHELASEASRSHRALACVVFAPEIDPDEPVDESRVDASAAFVARVLKAFGRRSDTIGRMSRTEFAVIATGTDEAGAQLLATRVAEAASRENGSKERPEIRLRSGCFAIEDLSDTTIEPAELLVRATMALRKSQPDSVPVEPVRFTTIRPHLA